MGILFTIALGHASSIPDLMLAAASAEVMLPLNESGTTNTFMILTYSD
jgi:hypothetical protein